MEDDDHVQNGAKPLVVLTGVMESGENAISF